MPLKLAQKLYKPEKKNLAMVTFGKELKLRHTDIYQFEGLSDLVLEFVEGKDTVRGEMVCRLHNFGNCISV